nr:PKD domain-containing protein [uncultured Pedobacter sp.]
MFKIFLKGFVFLLFLSLGLRVFGQGASNKGTDFWLGYGKHISVGQMVVYITSDVATTATVSIANLNFSQTVTVPANGIVSVDIPTAAHLANDGFSPNGIHITSLKPIIVYAHIYANSVSGATLVLPVNALGKDYYSINYKQISNSNDAVSWFFVIAVEDSTQVEITPSQNTAGGWAANTSHIVKLNKGEIYNVLGTYTNVVKNSSGADLTGSRVKSVSSNGSCKKIAVFSGSSKISINCLSYTLNSNPGSADNLFQQAYPTDTWGKNFITVPQRDRDFVIYRICKSDPAAVVKLNGNIIPASSFTSGFYYDFSSTGVEQISSDLPIQVAQYAVTQGKGIGCNGVSGDVGDPEMIYLNPLEQTLTKITMYSTPRYQILKHFINVVIKNEGVASFTVDGLSVSSQFLPVPNNTGYSYAQISVTEGTHNLSSDIGFNAIAYGFGGAESYGYAAGANLTAFGIDPLVEGTTDKTVQTGCVGVPYDLTLKLPYQASQLQFDSGDGNGLKIISLNPLPDIVKDGKTTYVYSLIPQITYSKDSTYSYKVVTTKPSADACGSGDEFLFDFIINPKPVADFTTASQACVDNPISFQAAKIPNQTITEYLWDFNGEGTANTESTTHTYTTPGIKKNKLSVKSDDGCWSDVKEVDVEVVALPVADFSQQSITCVGGDIQFTDKSTSASNNITKWEWDFGDSVSNSNTSTLQNPIHNFSKVKTYNVSLKVTTDLGCENLIKKQVVVHPLPLADFDMPDICLSDASAGFTNQSTVADGSTMTYAWDFGDNNANAGNPNTSTATSPTHRYTRADIYQVTLTATSTTGCSTTITKTFTVNGSTPKSKFAVQNENNLCSDQAVIFEDLASVDFGEITKIEWIYDDSKPAEMETDDKPATSLERTAGPKLYKHAYPSFFSPAQKTVNVSMKVYSGISCASTFTKTITLKAIPKADFILPDACLVNGESVFANQSTFVGSDAGLTYLWDFGDGSTTSNDKNPVHKFTVAKDYQITLTVTATNGCTNTITKTFTVNGTIPNPDFSVSNVNDLCSDQAVVFTDATTTAFGEISKIEWNFDIDNHPNDPAFQLADNSPAPRSATAKTYQFTYPKFSSPATRNVKVRMLVTSNGGCLAETTRQVTLKAVPNVVFNNLTDVCAEVPPFVFNQATETTGFSGTGSYTGDGVDANGLFSPAKAGVGKHTITYTFVGDNGCSATKTQDINVFATPTVDAGTDKIILTGGQIVLDANATGKNISYKWTPSTGLNRDDILNPIASPTKDIVYTLMVTSDDGCKLADDIAVKVLEFPEIPNTFTPNGDGVNDTWNIKYLDSYPNCTIKVFNRYGKEVFYTQKYIPWDGKQNGQYLPEGMYYYIITAKDGELKYSGSLLLVK